MEDTPTIWEEIFGPALVVAGCGSLASGYFFTQGSLAVSIYADLEDDVEDMHTLIDESFIGPTSQIAADVRQRTGRLAFNSPPTGVRVATSMVHGGPFFATNAPHTTAVGPLAIERWCRPICYQNCPDAMLPAELQNTNPRGIWRTVNGDLTKEPLA
jgi:NADP-dependent aldehyde dehydrogenase